MVDWKTSRHDHRKAASSIWVVEAPSGLLACLLASQANVDQRGGRGQDWVWRVRAWNALVPLQLQ